MQSSSRVLVFFIFTSFPGISCFPSSSPPKDNSPETSPNPLLPSLEASRSSEEDAADNSSADYSVEEKCSEDEFWHIRGKNCVPFRCPRANWMRDENTGQCLHRPRDNFPLKSFSGYELGSSIYKMRTVSRPQRVYGGRGMYVGTRWTGASKRQKIMVDDAADMDRILRPGLVG